MTHFLFAPAEMPAQADLKGCAIEQGKVPLNKLLCVFFQGGKKMGPAEKQAKDEL